MNTADIRDTYHEQGFFWLIAVPVTAGVVGVSVLVAYRGDKMFDALNQSIKYLKKDPQAIAARLSPINSSPSKPVPARHSSFSSAIQLRGHDPKTGVQRSKTYPILDI